MNWYGVTLSGLWEAFTFLLELVYGVLELVTLFV